MRVGWDYKNQDKVLNFPVLNLINKPNVWLLSWDSEEGLNMKCGDDNRCIHGFWRENFEYQDNHQPKILNSYVGYEKWKLGVFWVYGKIITNQNSELPHWDKNDVCRAIREWP